MSRIQELEDNKVLLQRLEDFDVEIAKLKESTENSDWWIAHLRKSIRTLWRLNICSQFMVFWTVITLWFVVWDPFGSD